MKAAWPPRLAERLLLRCLRHAPAAMCIAGDLRQEYAAIRGRHGRMAADLWYWREAAAIGMRYAGRSPRTGRGLPGERRPGGQQPALWRELASELGGALRVFRTAPGFAASVIVTLALGLGANATMFGAVDRVLLSPPEHVRDHESLRFVYLSGLGARTLQSPMAYSFPDYESLRDLPVLEGAAAYRPRRQLTMGAGPEARQAIVQDATAEFFPLLGVRPARGRLFDASDDRPGAAPVAVLSHRFWEREFDADPAAIGRTVTLASHAYEIIGIAPPGFTGANLEAVDVWVPARMNVALTAYAEALRSRGAWWFRVIVRLADGVTDEQAAARMTAAHTASVAAAVEAGDENLANAVGAAVHTGSFIMATGPTAGTGTTITLWLAGVSLLVLLIACANVAHLMLARGIDRRRERAVRLALGVSRRRLVSQALAEALVLALAGGLAAVLVTYWSGRALYGLLLPGIPLPDATVGGRLIGFVAVVVLATTVAAGLLPALQALRTAPGDVLRAAGRGVTRGGRAGGLLTVAQVGLSTVLLVGAGLFVQSLQNALEVDPGFDYDSVINIALERRAGVGPEQRDALHREALDALAAMPGVERAILSSSNRPLNGWDEQHDMKVSRVGELPRASLGGPYTYDGTEGYVETAGLRVIQGRAFESDEYAIGGPLVVMVSRAFAEEVWPGLDPLQECVTLRQGWGELDGPEPCRPVVGVYENLMVRSLADRNLWSVTWPRPVDAPGLNGILVRVEGDATEMVQPIRERLAALSDEIRYVHVLPMTERVARMRGPWRTGATLFSAFGILALAVASLGLYSVLAVAVAASSREIGIRAALGAQRRDLVAMVMTRAASLVGAGLTIGIAASVFAGRFLESVLFDVAPVNAGVFGAVAGVLVAAGLLAAWVPAWRATAVDPVRAIASE